MSYLLSQYPLHPGFRSAVVKSPPDAVPPTDVLEELQAELTEVRQQTLEKAKKAMEDLKRLDESMRKLKEKEKGKARAIEKVKRERGFTPIPTEPDEGRVTSHSQPPPAPRYPSIPLASTSSRSSLDPRKSMPDELKKKKKKRKRDDESDDDADSQRTRKASPLPSLSQPQPQPYIPKAAKPTGSFANLPTKLPSGPDFTLAPPSPLLPPRPPIPPPPIPGPSKPTDVTEDFSKAKQPSQVLVSTFYSSVEPYLRPIKEEDIGFLEYSGDEVEPFFVPRLGTHYTEQWEDEDINMYGAVLPSTQAARTSSSFGRVATAPPYPKWDPATLSEQDILTEERGHGPLTERLVSALLPAEDSVVWKGVKAAEEAMEGRHGVGVGTAAGRQVIVEDLERRIRDSLRFHKLLDSNPDFSDPVDDPIATALRAAQRELRTVVAANKARKSRLAAIARDRLGYQEYLELRESIDKNILALYTKLQKKDGPKASKKKKKGAGVVNGTEVNGSGPPPLGTWPASLGLGPDDDNLLRVPDQLRQLVETRRQWVDAVGSVFEEKEREAPGRIWGLPHTSVYEGIEGDVEALLERMGDANIAEGRVPVGGKGKGRARGDAMDLG
ncbi:hypothetical protein FA95DRAFT_1563903 [Auriscalpium vulgare]|uniref:Uncharacterized protein n=1 Tax=Auriscalpium vulgare TaxID=40419 RepID=A0ACB8RFH6_9AGAM|nr:hypothetical protein FA95DRAFT_1563903 [Auriscalpium vulgare]